MGSGLCMLGVAHRDTVTSGPARNQGLGSVGLTSYEVCECVPTTDVTAYSPKCGDSGERLCALLACWGHDVELRALSDGADGG